MLFRHVPLKAIWVLHHACGGQLAPAIVHAIDAGLAVHLFASRMGNGTRSVVVLGTEDDGKTKTYVELPLTEPDKAARWAWRNLDRDQMVSTTKEKLQAEAQVRAGGMAPELGEVGRRRFS